MLIRMFERRLRGYRAIGYARGVTPGELEESSDELVGRRQRGSACALRRSRVKAMTRTRHRNGKTGPRRLTGKARLGKLVEEATVEEVTIDCYDESEQPSRGGACSSDSAG